MPPWTRGWRVFTRPPRISGACVNSPTGTTFKPASARARWVPPVETSSTPFAARRRAKGTSPAVSDTERMARRTMRAPRGKGAPCSVRAVETQGPSASCDAARRAGPKPNDPAPLGLVGLHARLGRDPRFVLGDGAQLEQPTRLDLADALAGEVHDRPHLLERDAAPVGDVERAGLVELPDLPVREVQLDGARLRVHVQVQVVLAGDEHARPRRVGALRARPRPRLLDLLDGLLQLGIDEPERALPPQVPRDLLSRHRLRAAPPALALAGRGVLLRLRFRPCRLIAPPRLAHPALRPALTRPPPQMAARSPRHGAPRRLPSA